MLIMLPILSNRSARICQQIKNLRRFSSAASTPKGPQTDVSSPETLTQLREYRHKFPEFLPDPTVEFRNPVREKLERRDMIARRNVMEVPEFYVGSILAVSLSDPHAPDKPNRFLGICIKRAGCGLRANFILRNVIDHQGVEILYEIYDPTIRSIEVLRLEKRLDSHLLYLRDALPEYSTFDPDMEEELLSDDAPIPINDIKVKLKPRPWLERWERQNLKGVQDLELPEKFYKRAAEVATPWERYDLMKEYMRTIPEEEQIEIYAELQSQLPRVSVTQKAKRKRTFVKPTKLA